ncbi:NIL domain-containing protein [Calothrix sp. NIES-2098]|uniref:NIL domain-containing protein n=1 Tax=Calothrix sp. NIES-2098 TaxID=1954171 RepID=UPI000B5DEC81|nr:hypothetical protein NIES2098_05840 [Calothrix sp. NIES-2098]
MSPDKAQKSSPIHSRITVPQKYHRQPVISRLVSRYGLTVNITAASLVSGSETDGWFDLELSGNPQQLTSSLSYLQELGVNLVQLAIANQIQFKQQSQPFPNPLKQIITNQSETLKTQWKKEFKARISQDQTNRLRLQLCILKHYYQTPIISQLVSRYGLTVNIISGFLKADMQDDGWFDLDLWGRKKQLYYSLSYLNKLGIPIWPDWSSTVGHKFLE